MALFHQSWMQGADLLDKPIPLPETLPLRDAVKLFTANFTMLTHPPTISDASLDLANFPGDFRRRYCLTL